MFIQRLAQAGSPDELFHLLNGFLATLRTSPSAYHLPARLRPARMASVRDLRYWSAVLHAEVERQEANGRLSEGVLFYVMEILDTASMRIRNIAANRSDRRGVL